MLKFIVEILGDYLGASVRYLFFWLIGEKPSFDKLLDDENLNGLFGIITVFALAFLIYLIVG